MAKFTDVTQEYIDKAKPGNGSVTCGKGYNLKTHKDEINVAEYCIWRQCDVAGRKYAALRHENA